MRIPTYCLLALAAAVALAPAAGAQFGNRPDDMHIHQIGYPSPGSRVALTFDVTAAPGPNLGYQAAVSQGWRGGVQLPGGQVPLTPDSFFFVTAQNLLPSIFTGFGGKLDAQGRATASITVPPIPALDSVALYMAFVVYDTTGVRGISRAHKFQILDRPQTAACGNTPSTGIEVVDLDGKSIVKSIPVGAGFAQSPFYDLSLRHILVSTWAGLFHQIDIHTNSVLQSFQFSSGVNNMVGGTTAMTTSGERAFVCNASSTAPSVVEVDLATFREVKNHLFPVGMGRCAGIAVRPFSSEALVTCFISTTSAIYQFDVESGAIATVAALNTVDNPQDAVWRPQGDYVFVAQNGSATSTFPPAVLAYDATQGYRLARTIPIGTTMPGPAGIAMAPDGTYLYADSVAHNSVTKVDTDPASPGFLTVIKTIPFPAGWTSGGWMIRNYDGSKVYALLSTGLGELDTATDQFSSIVVPTTSAAAIMSARHRQDL
ncbi:MAG: hypothetical protein JXQ29_14630 [Planctomycetes bacterium]|nr:hypothetical protein [Planctomycetota bacterium]